MNYDTTITEIQQQKQKKLDEMEVKKEIFLDELAKFTANWFEKQTLSAIKENAEKVIELGEDKARELKGKIKDLNERTPELVIQYMDVQHLWWHTNEDKSSYFPNNNKLSSNHEKTVRLMFGELGKILIEYGIAKARSEHDRDYTSTYFSSWSYEGYDKSKLKFPFSIDYSKELLEIYNQYIELIKEAQDINEQIRHLEENKKKENVEDWWDSL